VRHLLLQSLLPNKWLRIKSPFFRVVTLRQWVIVSRPFENMNGWKILSSFAVEGNIFSRNFGVRLPVQAEFYPGRKELVRKPQNSQVFCALVLMKMSPSFCWNREVPSVCTRKQVDVYTKISRKDRAPFAFVKYVSRRPWQTSLAKHN